MSSITRRRLLVDGGRVAVGTGTLAALLAACGGSGGSSQSTVQYWAMSYQPNGANATGKLTDAAVAAYTRAHSNVKVRITGYTPDQAGYTKLTQAVRGGATVDLFRLPADSLPLMIKQGLVAPIDDYLTSEDKADIYPNLLDAIAVDGKHYAWPLWVPPVAMYLNVDVFKERNVELPGDSWTYDEFVEIAKKLTFTRSNGQNVYGYTGQVDPAVVNTWPFLLGDGALPLNKTNTKYTLNTPEGISGLQKIIDLAHKHKVTPPDFGTQATDDIATGFSQTKTYAMYSAPSGDSSNWKQMGLNFEIRPMPIGARGKPFTLAGIGLIVVAKNKDANREKAAMEFANYMTSSQVGKDVAGYYLAPGARKSVTVQDPISKFTPFVDVSYLPPLIEQWPQIRPLLHTQLQEAILGKKTAEQALNAPADEINSLLA